LVVAPFTSRELLELHHPRQGFSGKFHIYRSWVMALFLLENRDFWGFRMIFKVWLNRIFSNFNTMLWTIKYRLNLNYFSETKSVTDERTWGSLYTPRLSSNGGMKIKLTRASCCAIFTKGDYCSTKVITRWKAPMEGSVLSFLKAEWKVSDTGSAHWASSLM
jgi:hypothetical protein